MAKTLTAEIEAVVPEVGTMLYVVAPFDKAYEAIVSANGTLASARDVACARLHLGANHNVSTYGSWTGEGFIYTPKQNPLLVRNSPLVAPTMAQDATEAHRRGGEFYLDEAVARQFAQQAEEDASKPLFQRLALRMPKNKDYSIPTNRFGDDEVPQFLFGEQAAPYGQFLRSNGIKEMPVRFPDKSHVNAQSMSFLRQLWFPWLGDDYRSDLYGSDGGLHYGDGVRGVRPSNVAEGHAHATAECSVKSELSYDAREIGSYRTILQQVRKGDLAASELENVLKFIDTLPVRN
jgi:hypothetical protein